MFRWSQDWQMLFNLEKCSVMYMGKGNQELSYEMGGKVLKVSDEERDLGVIMHRSAKPSRQCAEASKKVNSTLGMIRRTTVTRDKGTILRLYKSLVRQQLEYCIQVWSPHLKEDMEKLEKVQRKNDSGLQGFELRGTVDKVWANNAGEKEEQRRLNRSL